MTSSGGVASICVIGGSNVDIEGRSDVETRPGDSVAGKIMKSAGGVGRNIAENLAHLGAEVRLLSVVGDDSDGSWLKSQGVASGIEMRWTLVQPGQRTARYVSIVDAGGEVVAAVNDMAVLDCLTAELIDSAAYCLEHVDAVVLDCNLSADVIAHVCSFVDAPVFVDPVSVAKCTRVLPVLERIHTIKPNRAEAAMLTSCDTTADAGLADAADALLAGGVGNVVIGLGSEGAFYSNGVEAGFVRPDQVVPNSVTGAGDAQMAGLVLSHLEGYRLGAMVEVSVAAAAVAASSSSTVSPDISRALVGLEPSR
ncbi:MAG: carbohydrate kinase family protein [Acidimicrobiales bacterium]